MSSHISGGLQRQFSLPKPELPAPLDYGTKPLQNLNPNLYPFGMYWTVHPPFLRTASTQFGASHCQMPKTNSRDDLKL